MALDRILTSVHGHRLGLGPKDELRAKVLLPGATTAIDIEEALATTGRDIRYYGAKCDGLTDDTAAINLAIEATHDTGGGVVWLPAVEDQIMYDQIVLYRNVQVLGVHPYKSKLKQITGSNVNGVISESMDDLIGSGLSFGDGGTYQDGTIVTDTRVPSFFGIGNCYIDASGQSSGWAIKVYGNFFMSPGVTLVQYGQDGNVWVEASVDFAYNDSDVGAQEEALVNYLIARNSPGVGIRWRAHDSDIKSILAYDNDGGNIYFEQLDGFYNGGCNVGSCHSYFNINNGIGTYIDATVSISQLYIDNDNATFTTKSNGSSIGILKSIKAGFRNQTAINLDGSYINIGQVNMSAINTSVADVKLIDITGEYNTISGGYVNCAEVADEAIIGCNVAGTHNTVRLKVLNAAGTGSKGFTVSGSNHIIEATAANCDLGVEYTTGFLNRIHVNGFQNPGQTTFSGTAASSDIVTVLGPTAAGSLYANWGNNLTVDMLNDVVTVNAGEVHKTRTHTAAGAVTVAKTDYQVVVNKASGEATTVNLPASPAQGQTHVIKDGKRDAHTNPITITPASGTIDGAASFVIRTAGASATLVYSGSEWNVVGHYNRSEALVIAASDETTALTTGMAKMTFRMPYAFTLREVRASVTTAPTDAALVVDINESNTSILSTKLSIDSGEKTSTTAATPAVISDTALADDAEITVDIDAVGSSTAGAGLKIYLIGSRS